MGASRRKSHAQKKKRHRTRRGLTRPELAIELGKRLGKPVHPQTISKWVEQGLPVAQRGRGGMPSLYEFAKCWEWVEARRESLQTDEPVDALRERARKERAQAELAEQLYQTRAGKLIPVEDVEKVLRAQQTAVRTKMLAIPTTKADMVCRAAVLEGVSGVERELRLIAHDVLRELADPDLYKPEPVATASLPLEAPTAPSSPEEGGLDG